MVVRRWKTIGYLMIATIGVWLAVLAATKGTAAEHVDDAFVNQIRGLGIGFTSSDAVIAAANDVCHSFQKGETAVAVNQHVLNDSHLNRAKASQFVAAAVHSYCPRYSDKLAGNSAERLV